jgi:hypothetical protein
MELTREQLDEIEKLSSLFFTYREIAVALKLDFEEFIEEVTDEDADAYRYYEAGKIQSEVEIREQMVSMAKMGSPAAQQEVRKLAEKQKISEDNA